MPLQKKGKLVGLATAAAAALPPLSLGIGSAPESSQTDAPPPLGGSDTRLSLFTHFFYKLTCRPSEGIGTTLVSAPPSGEDWTSGVGIGIPSDTVTRLFLVLLALVGLRQAAQIFGTLALPQPP